MKNQHSAWKLAAVVVAIYAATGLAQSTNPFGIPTRRQAATRARPSRPCRARARKAGSRRAARKCSRATASSPRAIRWPRRRGSRSCARAATRSTPPSRPAPCSTSRRRTTPASAAISSRSSGRRKTRSSTRSTPAAGRRPAGRRSSSPNSSSVTRVPGNGVNAATVPGAISGYDALLKRFGTMTFKETFERAARIAEEGWGLAERRHSDLRGAAKGLLADPDSKQTFLDGDAGAGALQHHPQSRRWRRRCGSSRSRAATRSTAATSPTRSSPRCRPTAA